MEDSPIWEYAKNTQSDSADFIYFDDEKDENNEKIIDTVALCRNIVSLFIQASNNNAIILQTYLSAFAGCSLREQKEITGKSHEWCRQQIKKLEDKYPDLYRIMSQPYRPRIQSIIPVGSTHKWEISLDSGETFLSNNLKKWCKDNDISYEALRYSKRLNKKYKNINVKKVF